VPNPSDSAFRAVRRDSKALEEISQAESERRLHAATVRLTVCSRATIRSPAVPEREVVRSTGRPRCAARLGRDAQLCATVMLIGVQHASLRAVPPRTSWPSLQERFASIVVVEERKTRDRNAWRCVALLQMPELRVAQTVSRRF
jgi:hypothetical protein